MSWFAEDGRDGDGSRWKLLFSIDLDDGRPARGVARGLQTVFLAGWAWNRARAQKQ